VRSRLTTVLPLAVGEVPLTFERGVALDNGTAANQADRIWHSSGQIAASSFADIDLNGSLTDPFGAAVNLLRVKGLFISAAPGNTNNLVVGNAAANGFISWVGAAAHTLTIRPGCFLAL